MDALAYGVHAYCTEDFEEAFAVLSEQAAEGEPEALYYLALMYRDGDGTPVDEVAMRRCIREIQRLADGGCAAAQHRFGMMKQYGDLVAQSDLMAFRYIQMAVDQGQPEAQFHLSCLYRYGWCGLDTDPQRALDLLQHAARSGHPEAMYTLHRENGDFRLLVAAAEAGFEPAEELLRRMRRE